ncbi:CHAT domain-containing protein [Stutzerimonas stutzeri]|uniref:CHAT domain-containing protein n=1 Tax=Stutzerimonas stutzeri TaxID=316 RepID=UPI00244BA3BA|nr:CHAT domain-containing protein [Stutzerimonas stutzeri]MDH0155013.1 CHAT domain-containing protein [Stutzerimonas stutzeri]
MKLEQSLAILHDHLDKVFHDARLASSISHAEVKKLIGLVIIQQNSAPVEDRLLPHYYQFIFATEALYASYKELELTEMGNWIGLALSEDTKDSHTKTLNVGRVADFYSSAAVCNWAGFVPVMVKFFSAFYYYARERTAMNNIARELWSFAVTTFKETMNSPAEYIFIDEAYLGSHMACWAAKEAPDLAKIFVPHLESVAETKTIPNKVRALLYYSLTTTASAFSSKTPYEWAATTLAGFSEILAEPHKLQLLATIYAGDKEGDPSALLSQIDLVQGTIKNNLDGIAFFRDAAMRAGSIQPFIVKTLNTGETHLALQGLLLWHQLLKPNANVTAEDLYISVPFGEHGYFAALGDQKTFVERDSQAALEQLVHSSNEFLGVAKTIAYSDNSGLAIPNRIGVPKYGDSEVYETALTNGYCFSPFPFRSKPSCQLIIDTECTPLQAIQLKVWGETWPITSSLSTPKPDRKPQRILIWCGGGSLTEELETEVIKYIFESAGATVNIVLFTETTKQSFLDAYQDPQYDIIWVASHGEFDHWSPKHVTMHIGDDLSVSLEDLWEMAPVTDKRRLAFLNICDGARFEERGFLPKIGMAPGLANADQATISHLWPVMGYPAAAFGAYLAYNLATGSPYFESYKMAVLSIRRTTLEIAEDLASKIGGEFDLIRQLRGKEENYSPLEFYGSAAFYQ